MKRVMMDLTSWVRRIPRCRYQYPPGTHLLGSNSATVRLSYGTDSQSLLKNSEYSCITNYDNVIHFAFTSVSRHNEA